MKPRFRVGQKFIRQGRKAKRIETIVDIHTTTNLNGEVVKIRYVAEHEFIGQTVKDYDVCDSTIARGLYRAAVVVSKIGEWWYFNEYVDNDMIGHGYLISKNRDDAVREAQEKFFGVHIEVRE